MSIRLHGRESPGLRRFKLAYLIPSALVFCILAGPIVGWYDLLTYYVFQLRKILR